MAGTRALILLTTVASSADGDTLASALVEERLAACVSLIGPIHSTYRWEGSVQRESEILLLIKSTEDRREDLERRLTELHPYDVPEILFLEPSRAGAPYLAWLEGSTKKEPGR